MRIVATAVVGLGLLLILWLELAAAGERRTVGPLRDIFEVLVPVAATVALVVGVWVY
ncbi:MAG: hypothetical protein QNJ89_00425 [Acidimicrobiia bacterium]|nr:hypothetical protein [Acidimicrobiia bacterium]